MALAADDPPVDGGFRTQVLPLVEKYCGKCHGPEKPAAILTC